MAFDSFILSLELHHVDFICSILFKTELRCYCIILIQNSLMTTKFCTNSCFMKLVFLFQDEWKTKPSKKKKIFPSSTPISAPDKISIDSDLLTNHINEEPEQKPPKSSKVARGGKRGGNFLWTYNALA